MKTTFETIVKKYSEIQHNDGNYGIGGGLSDEAWASNRHQDAKHDEGKLTLGNAKQLFKKATGLELDFIDLVIKYAVPNMEWHHAGFLPKSYGGGMKKTYFLNAIEIVDLAKKWNSYCEKLELSIADKKTQAQLQNELEIKKHAFLIENATKKVRVQNKGLFFYETDREMNGKYGWFSSYGKSYNMTEYYTGWEFETAEKANEFFNIK